MLVLFNSTIIPKLALRESEEGGITIHLVEQDGCHVHCGNLLYLRSNSRFGRSEAVNSSLGLRLIDTKLSFFEKPLSLGEN